MEGFRGSRDGAVAVNFYNMVVSENLGLVTLISMGWLRSRSYERVARNES